MKFVYTPKGVCSRQITVEVEDGIVKDVAFIGGCNGNLKVANTLFLKRSNTASGSRSRFCDSAA